MDAKQRNEDQQSRWNGPAGNAWVEAQHVVDAVLRPFEEILVDTARALSPRQVLDVGCGTGGTTLAVAAALGSSQVLGVDISEPMIAAAQARAAQHDTRATFLRADAQTHSFEPNFDLIMSRFGVMFFENPVRAFTNLRRAATGELRCVVWRDVAENPFMTAAERAAAPLLPDLPARIPDAPGQFGLADGDRTARILRDSGWTDIAVDPIDVECVMPEEVLTWYFSTLGPVGMHLAGVDEATRARVVETVRPAFDPFVHGDEVRYTAACWMLSAHV
ncbi:class I SAM-dependent methyltransferase [Nocardia goodfellowii]|uniref:SAM-dependent methyltransferase n=1 Tax=Nocardia goodfellowii TaxID=882446 RepID=A0ABS4QHW3_9NOCA|nr:class I SAM-dependent methyltransferase [Nocardia goodfellowii]MBP2191284.1 SAM-dependent methyltransferase [Nocardia goodfellowii]